MGRMSSELKKGEFVNDMLRPGSSKNRKKTSINIEAKRFKNLVKKNNKSGVYEMWITYNSNKKRLQIPVLPEEITISYPEKNDTVYVYGVGDVTVKKHPGAFVIKFSSFFPAKACQGSIPNPKKPKAYREFLKKVMEIKKPAKFIFTGSPCRINKLCTIDFEISEQAGDAGTIYYSLTITEYKKVHVRKIKVKKNKKKGRAGKLQKRISTKVMPNTYLVKKGDNLFNISRRFFGSGDRYMDIYKLNRNLIGSNPNHLLPDQVLVMPD